MSDKRQGVMGSLPSTRPHRRSDRRPAADAVSTDAGEPAAAKKPAGAKKPAAARKPAAATAKAKASKPTPGDGNVARRSPSDRARAKPTGGRPAAKKPPANVRRRTPVTPPPATHAEPAAPPPRRTPTHEPSPDPDRPGAVETLVQAAAELTEIGLRVSARAVRGAVSRLPRP